MKPVLNAASRVRQCFRRSIAFAFVISSGVLLLACSAKENHASRGADAYSSLAAAPAPMMERSAAAGGVSADKPAQAQSKRFIALSHQLVVETESAALQAVYEDAVRRCEAAGCEVLSASLTRGDDYATPSADLSVRIPPQAVAGFLGGLEKGARVIQHQRQAEDKTAEVVDAEARIANLTELRDRLRAMVASRPGNIKDVLEVERQLSETQTQLDSVRGLRKALANETEKVAMNIRFQARRSITEQSFFAPVVAAWHEAGGTVMNSVAVLISFIAAMLPWVLAGILAAWVVRLLWRRWRRARATA